MNNTGVGIYLFTHLFWFDCEELPLKIRQLLVEQLSGTLRPEGDVSRSQLASACPTQSIAFPILPQDGATSDL